MEDLLRMQALAEEKMKNASHLLLKIYPEVNDPQMLVGISDTIYEAVSSSINAAVSLESQMSRLRAAPSSFIDALNQLSRLQKRYSFDPATKSLLYELHEFMVEKKNVIKKKESVSYRVPEAKQKIVDTKKVKEYMVAANSVIADIKLKLSDR